MQQYTVRSGDTLFLIARRFGTTVQAILAVNPTITNPNIIVVGQVIWIPVPPTPAPSPSPSPSPSPVPCPRLERGDRGPAVIRLQQALAANGFPPGPIDGIFGPRTEAAVRNFQATRGLQVTGIVNRVTWIALGVNCITPTPVPTPSPTPPTPTVTPTPPTPTVTPAPRPGFWYEVVIGDTLFIISIKFGVSLQAIIAANPQISDPNFIVPGQRIFIPTA